MFEISVKDTAPLTFIKQKNGVLVAGLSITVSVIDARTGTQLLESTPCVEVSPGVYTFVWNHNLNDEMECIALYSDGTHTYAENFNVENEEEYARTV